MTDIVLAGPLTDPLAGDVDVVVEHRRRRLDELVRDWLIAHASGSEDTYAAYTAAMDLYLEFSQAIGVDPLDPRQATKNHTDAWHRVMAQTPTRTGRPPAPATLAHRVSVISSFYRYLEDEDVLTVVPIRRRTRPQAPTESSTVGLSAAEQLAVEERLELRDADGERIEPTLDRAVMLTLDRQGLRGKELRFMRVGDLSYAEGEPVMAVCGKGGRIRTIVIDTLAHEAILDLIRERYGDEPPPEAFIFVRPDGSVLSQDALANRVRRICRAAGVRSWEKITPHSMRHTSITMMLNAGESLNAVQIFHGHASPTTTVRYDRAAAAISRSARAVHRRADYLDQQRNRRQSPT